MEISIDNNIINSKNYRTNKLFFNTIKKKLLELLDTAFSNDAYILVNNKILNIDNNNNIDSQIIKIQKLLEELNYVNITLNKRVRGGLIDVIVESLMGILKFLLLIPKILMWILEFVLWFIRFIIFLLKTFMGLLFGGFEHAVKFVTITMITAPFDFIKLLIKHIFGDGIIEKRNEDLNKCYIPSDGSVPTTVLIATLLCPPLGVFMVYGLTAWLSILISAVLSLAYYFPGMIFALIKIYTDMDL